MRSWLPVLAVSVVACSADPTASTPAAAKVCAADPRVVPFDLGVESASAAKTMRVRIVAATPPSVIQGVNDWTLAITDGAGAPLDGLAVTVKPVMPDHGHGSSTVPVVTALGGGRYRSAGISMPMRGVWAVSVVVTGAVNDSATFTFCVDGA